jgi:hypothetical protein
MAIAATLSRVASAVGRGIFAGAAGTAAMTVSSAIESKLRGRGPSQAPATAASKVLGVQPRNPAGRARFSNAVHWAYGTSWGAARGLLDAAGINGKVAPVAHFAAVWGAEQAMLPALSVAPPAWKQPRGEVAIDALHHAVYVSATNAAYTALSH